jgi:hypothetical protein
MDGSLVTVPGGTGWHLQGLAQVFGEANMNIARKSGDVS